MIQRIQTIWLLLAAACAFAGLKFPFYIGTNAKNIASYKLNGTENFLLMSISIAVAALALITIFLFKKRNIQVWLCVLGIFLEALLVFLYYRETTTFVPATGAYSLAAILHGVIVVAFVLAIKGINKDAKLLRESDRLR